MTTLRTYEIVDEVVPAVLMVASMILAVILILGVTIAMKGKVPYLFKEAIHMYFPVATIDAEGQEVEVLGEHLDDWWLAALAFIILPAVIGTTVITFWNVFLVQESVRGDCEANFDCFLKIGNEPIQQNPANCSAVQVGGDVTYECFRFVTRYAQGLSAAGGIHVFTALWSKPYFFLLVRIYHGSSTSTKSSRYIQYGLVWAVASAVFIFYVAITTGVTAFREAIFGTVTDQIHFATYTFLLLVIIVSGVVVSLGLHTSKKAREKRKDIKPMM